MHPKSPKWLDDIRVHADLIHRSARSRTLADYGTDALFRHGIERCFEIIGEALSRLSKTDVLTASRISECQAIIGFRNILAHGYDIVDHEKVWQVIQDDCRCSSRKCPRFSRKRNERAGVFGAQEACRRI